MNNKFTVRTEKGKRPYQEDRHAIITTEHNLIVGVFDGHGGEEVSAFCAANLLPAWHAVESNLACRFDSGKMAAMFDYLNVRTEHIREGSTASIVIIPKNGDQVTVGILGDSPVLVKQDDGRIVASPQHNVRSNPEEVKAAQSRGGVIHNGYLFNGRGSLDSNGLQMSRALGDAWLGTVLSRTPDIYGVTVGKKSFILVGTDGLFDPAHEDDPSEEIAQNIEDGAEAGDLVDRALAIPTYDNVTAVLVRFTE